MLSPSSLARPREAPPVRPSRSLEGLEQVIPPRIPQPLSVRPTLLLDKALPELPAKPLPEDPSIMDAGSTAWSDDSSMRSSYYGSRRFSEVSTTESYPVFVRSGSDDLTGLVDHPPASAPSDHYRDSKSLAITATFLHDDHVDRPAPWTVTRAGPNHYFREKKWDFFPELAPQSALPACSANPAVASRKKSASKLNLAVFDFTKPCGRWSSRDKGGRALAHDVRDSIRSYVQRRLSKHSVNRDTARPDSRPDSRPDLRCDTVASNYTRNRTPSLEWSLSKERTDVVSPLMPPSPVESPVSVKRLSSASSRSTTCSRVTRPPPLTLRKKQLALSLSPYQKQGPSIWEKPGREKRISYRQNRPVRFPKYGKRGPPTPKGFVTSATPPLTPPACSQIQQNTRDYVKAFHHGTSHLWGALGGARKKIAGSKLERRHSQLKSQIRLIGPVSPYNTQGQTDPWV
ncbi:uncharacterized protein BP01DRAFT_372111 [Aspergillus saccharolyticus JOP 1030-1]|uniref:Uncharacterized protein n=1 Tax=Aspergillus saccharolyticus JOP 1030-1 TaxID=1450539 RepID=A0A318ZK66_9EURO|nr:hypothetical protein BP01DRAFT_372111 [Aspergillus saccharolyticus JOP 1030-1]PYH47949.1 hypothetical protein BP01DRAFT_372111 [Aspergillus saccharolyticus JOP 1030-1]